MEEQLYGLLQTGIYAGTAMVTVLASVGIYCAARFGAANILAKNEVEKERAARLEKALENPEYQKVLDRRFQFAQKLRDAGVDDSDDLEAQLNSACGKLI